MPALPTTQACSTQTWGSTAKSSRHLIQNPIIGLRAGRHACFDRLVIDLRSTPPSGWSVHYGDVRTPGQGKVIPLRGAADLEIVADAPAHDTAGHTTYRPAKPTEAVDVSGFQTFRQVAFAGSFEGTTTFGLGVRARLPFHVTTATVSGRSVLVIDVAHTWSASAAS